MKTIERIKEKLERGEDLTPDEGWALWHAIEDARQDAKRQADQVRREMWEDERIRNIAYE